MNTPPKAIDETDKLPDHEHIMGNFIEQSLPEEGYDIDLLPFASFDGYRHNSFVDESEELLNFTTFALEVDNSETY